EPRGPNRLERDEPRHGNVPRRLRLRRLQVRVVEGDEDARLDLETAPDVTPRHLLAIRRIHHVLAHGGAVARVQQAEVHVAILHRRVEAHGDGDLPEADHAAPDRPCRCHRALLAGFRSKMSAAGTTHPGGGKGAAMGKITDIAEKLWTGAL